MSKIYSFLADGTAAASAIAAVPQAAGNLHRIVWRRRRPVLAITGVCLLLAMIWLCFATRIYRAEARFEIRQGTAGAPIPDQDLLSNQRERLLSRTVLALAASRAELRDLQTFHSSDTPLEYLREHVSARIGRGGMMSVYADSPYPEDAPVIVNAVLKSFVQYETQPKFSSVSGALDELNEQLAADQAKLNQITDKMRGIEARFGILTDDDQAHGALAQLPAITQQLTAAKLEALKDRSDYEEALRVAPDDATPADRAGGMPAMNLPHEESEIRSELSDAQADLVGLRQHYLPSHPAILDQQRRVELLSRAYADALMQKWMTAKRREDSLQGAYDQQQQLAVDIGSATAEYGRLKIESDRLNRRIESLDTRTAAIESARDAATLVIDPFGEADSAVKISPQIFGTLLLALLFGLGLGSGIVVFSEEHDDRLGSAEAAASALGLPVLGSVPALAPGLTPMMAGQQVSFEPGSEAAASFRAVRASIHANAPKDRSRTLLVTSPAEQDGKTVSAANLAVAMAQAGHRTLLVDANMRQPAVHSIFGVRDTTGLATLLAGQGKESKAIQATSTKRLSVLPAGPTPVNPAELLNTPILAELLEHLADQYDQIVIDAPALSAGVDARILAAVSDLTLLVVRPDTISRRAVLVARDALMGVGARILGLVVRLSPDAMEAPIHQAAVPTRPAQSPSLGGTGLMDMDIDDIKTSTTKV